MPDDVIPPVNSQERSYEARRSGRASGAVEVRVRAVRRRDWTLEERLQIVRETLEPGAIAKAVAERHGIGTGLLYTWRKNLLATAMARFSAVQVVPEVPSLEGPGTGPSVTPGTPAPQEAVPGLEVTFSSGARLVMRGDVSPAVFRELVAELARR